MGKQISFLKKVVQPNQKKSDTDRFKWLKRFGIAGFLFFFLKGLIWIAVFLGLGKAFSNLF